MFKAGTLVVVAGVMLLGSAARAEDAKAKAPAKAKFSDAQLTKMATTAGPADLAKDATVMVMEGVGPDMKMRQIKAGTNGWMCMVALGMGEPDSMCLDKEWQGWAEAWMGKKDPQVKAVGVAYMLNGDHGASNTDPYAEKATADNQWVVSPAHVMVLSPDTKMLDALPTDPKNGGPWVMWKGTKYAHIMVPMQAMPKQPAKPAK